MSVPGGDVVMAMRHAWPSTADGTAYGVVRWATSRFDYGRVMGTLGLQGPRASRAGAPTSEGARPLICVAGSGHGSPAPAR
ncbi:MAG: hypothetical protein RXO30_08385, partial [Thermoproteus sp.]